MLWLESLGAEATIGLVILVDQRHCNYAGHILESITCRTPPCFNNIRRQSRICCGQVILPKFDSSSAFDLGNNLLKSKTILINNRNGLTSKPTAV
jgi:hypothetical protein